jgi:CRP-like cAMP-binding protein
MIPILLGEFLLEKEAIAPDHLEEALAKQHETPGKKLGQILLELGHVSARDLDEALALQAIFRGGVTDGRAVSPQNRRGELLRQITFFSDLTQEDLDLLAAKTSERKFPSGYRIFSEGDLGDAMYIILGGAVAIMKQLPGREEEPLAVLKTGNFFGEMALLDAFPRSASAVVTREADLLLLSRKDLDNLLVCYTGLGCKLYKVFATTLSLRLREMDEKLKNLLASQALSPGEMKEGPPSSKRH